MPRFFVILSLITSYLLLPLNIFAQECKDDKCPAAGILQIQELILRTLNIIVGLGFVALTVMLVWAGVKFIISGGEAKEIQQIWGIVTWAFLGALMFGIAWLVIQLIGAWTGVPVTTFCLGFPGADTGCN